MREGSVILCPGQGAQAVGMGAAWAERSAASREIFRRADAALGDALGAPLSDLCFSGPADRLNDTDVAQPAIYACSIACFAGGECGAPPAAAAGLSLGEYTALHLAGVFDFETGLDLVARRGRFMQEAAEASDGGMVALIGADEPQARAVANAAVAGSAEVLVCANFNAPGQIVLSGHRAACERALEAASAEGLRATSLAVAGAFHSPLMQPAADRMAEVLAAADLAAPRVPVWSNVTAAPHEADPELLRRRLVEQVVSPVRWEQSCRDLAGRGYTEAHELAPGTVLRGLMRRIDRNLKVHSHDQPDENR